MSKTDDKKTGEHRSLDGLVLCLKEQTGISTANCETCIHLGSDGDGYEYNGTWPVCDERATMSNLKSFPFKAEQNCWRPHFWHSKFADEIDGTDESFTKAARRFHEAVEKAENRVISGKLST